MTALATDSGRKTPAHLAGSAILACQSDDRLVELVRSGHERAFDAIVERYRKPLVHYCARFLPESRCEDAVQQAFINAHTALLGSGDEVRLKPWLYTVARNAALNMLRQNGWNYEQIPLDFDGVRRPDQIFEERFELQRTVAAVGDLPERQRDALVMREFEGRSYDEIALALGANDGAVRQLLNRARVTLRNAATLLTPPPLLERVAASMPQADGRRVAEVFAGFGAAGVAKAGATALVAGSLVVGAVEVPRHESTPTRPKPAPAVAAAKPSAARETPVASTPTQAGGRSTHSGSGDDHGSHSGRGHEGESRHSGSGEREGSRDHSGSGDDGRTRSGSDDSKSGSGERSGSGTSGGSDDSIETSGSSGSGTSGSGTSGSGELTTTSSTSGSGSSGSGSGSSGSGSGSSGSGSSGSGSGSDDSSHSGSDD